MENYHYAGASDLGPRFSALKSLMPPLPKKNRNSSPKSHRPGAIRLFFRRHRGPGRRTRRFQSWPAAQRSNVAKRRDLRHDDSTEEAGPRQDHGHSICDRPQFPANHVQRLADADEIRNASAGFRSAFGFQECVRLAPTATNIQPGSRRAQRYGPQAIAATKVDVNAPLVRREQGSNLGTAPDRDFVAGYDSHNRVLSSSNMGRIR